MKVLNVTDDLAERMIKMISDLSSNPLTQDEEDLQRIVQVVTRNQKTPFNNKSFISKYENMAFKIWHKNFEKIIRFFLFHNLKH
jgi:hypothetical protein